MRRDTIIVLLLVMLILGSGGYYLWQRKKALAAPGGASLPASTLTPAQVIEAQRILAGLGYTGVPQDGTTVRGGAMGTSVAAFQGAYTRNDAPRHPEWTPRSLPATGVLDPATHAVMHAHYANFIR